MVRDGQTIVLGGLFRESTVATRRQWPLLGDIPLIGSAFRGNEDQTERSEIIFLITPSIVDDSTLALDGEKGRNAVEQARAGARNGTLKWSRDRITSQLNVEAEKLAADGQTEKALWKLERSLSLSPMQPEVIAMREKLTGTRKPLHNRSMLDNILRRKSMRPASHRGSSSPSPRRRRPQPINCRSRIPSQSSRRPLPLKTPRSRRRPKTLPRS
jgi:hypothetical protein